MVALTLPRDDITLFDFMLSTQAVERDQPWFMDALTGETRTLSDIRLRVEALALGLTASLGETCRKASSSKHDSTFQLGCVISLISANDIDFATVVWAIQQMGCTVAPSNASGTSDELATQLRLCDAQAIIAHPTCLDRVLIAGKAVGIPMDRVFVLVRDNWVHP